MNQSKKWCLPDIIRRLILSWMTAAAAAYLQLSGKQSGLDGTEGLKEMSFLHVTLIAAVVFGGFTLLARFGRINARKAERCAIAAVYGILAAITLKHSFSVPFFCAAIGAGGIIGIYAIWGLQKEQYYDSGELHTKKCTAAVCIVIALAVLFFLFVSAWTVFSVLTYSAPTFDFGIFSQMFHQMKTTGLPYTTLERDGLFSHFKVHVSPIYYLLLPFYCLYPVPAALQLLQAVVLASAVLPAWKLARGHGCGPLAAVLLCMLLLLYPSYSGGASYDLHENVFLAPLLLWLFYGIDRRNGWMTAAFALLTLMVKEDAAVYVAVIGLWLLVRSLLRQDIRHHFGIFAGALLLTVSVVWFLLVTGYLARYGDGVMTYRYDNFIYDGSASLITVIKAVILSPMKMLYECTEKEKLFFLAMTMLPLCGIPIMTRKYERYLLLIPYVLVNLMPDYKYQHSIFFQYTYGSTACLFYLTVINYEDIAAKIKRPFLKYVPLILAAVISGVCFGKIVVPKAIAYPARYMENREYYKAAENMLKLVPEDASVAATTFYTVPLSNREVIYDVEYTSEKHLLSTEYVVLDTEDDRYGDVEKLLEENEYEVIAEQENTLIIYRKIRPISKRIDRI